MVAKQSEAAPRYRLLAPRRLEGGELLTAGALVDLARWYTPPEIQQLVACGQYALVEPPQVERAADAAAAGR